jgi:isoleucyl-tRNA synthetase
LPSTFSTLNRSSSSTSSTSNSSNSSSNPKKKEGKERKAEGEGKYSKTVFLPQTSFDQRANSLKREPEIQKWWDANKIYEKLYSDNTGDDFVLHDGPPYANGDLHIGHALNKILKDIINRYQMLRGKKVRYVPGWDCHGLPIELKVLQNMKSSEKQSLNPITLRTKAAEFAQKTMASQRDAFKRYGIWGDWDHPYLTLHKEYEAAQIKVFGEMVSKGHIYRGKKPVHWSPSSKTALAEAELEYPDNHISKSIFVGFGPSFLSSAFESHLEKTSTSKNDVFLVIWTTTPWTIPANLAIAVNSSIEYCLISHPKFSKKMVVAKDLVPSFSQKMGLNVKEGELFNIESCFSGAALSGTKYIHPIYQRESEVISGGDYITTETGTGLVHTAPGHGQEDYKVGQGRYLNLI